MAQTELEILLKADVDQATKAIQNFAKQVGVEIKEGIAIYDQFDAKIKEVQDSLKKASDPKDVARLTKELKSLQSAFSTIKSGAILQAGEGIKKAGASAANATPALTNFGRVIQDAPFGIIGVANNIDPLIDSFQRLKRETGSAATAFKALLSGLAGPAGLAIGVSALTSVLIAFGPQIKAFFTNTEELTEEQKKLAEQTRNVAESLSAEIVKVQSLAAIAGDENRTRKDRLEAVNALRKEYPKYLQGLTDEEALSRGVALASEAITKSLIKRIVIEASRAQLTKQIADELEKALKTEESLRQEDDKLTKSTEKRNAQYENYVQLATGVNSANLKLAAGARLATTEQLKTFGTADQSANRVFNRIRSIIEGPLTQLIQSLGGSAGDFTKIITGTDKEIDNSKSVIDEYNKSIIALGNYTDNITKFVRLEASAFGELGEAIEKVRNAQNKKNIEDKAAALIAATSGTQKAPAALGRLQVPTAITDVQASNAKLTAAAIQQIADATNNTNAAFALLSPAIDQAFNALANGQNAAEAVGQALKQLIVQLVKAVIQAAILSAILNTIAPGSTSLFGELSKILGFLPKARATGGFASAGSPYIVGESGPELFVPGTSGQVVPNMALNGAGSLVARVSGSDLLFILNNAQRSRGSVYG